MAILIYVKRWGSLTFTRIFFILSEGGDRNFFHVREGDQDFLPQSKGGPEKIDDISSQIDGPPPRKKW